MDDATRRGWLLTAPEAGVACAPMPLERTAQTATERSVEDREYVARVCETRDEAAFAELLQTMHTHATTYLRRYRGTETGVDDVMQNTDLNALKAFRDGKFDTSKRLRPWYFTLLTNASIDHNRRNARHDRSLSLDASPSGDGNLHGTLAMNDDPARAMELEEASEQLHAAIDGLPAQQQEGLKLLYWQCLKYREIAGAMDIPEGTLKSTLHSAKRKLHQLLADAA